MCVYVLPKITSTSSVSPRWVRQDTMFNHCQQFVARQFTTKRLSCACTCLSTNADCAFPLINFFTCAPADVYPLCVNSCVLHKLESQPSYLFQQVSHLATWLLIDPWCPSKYLLSPDVMLCCTLEHSFSFCMCFQSHKPDMSWRTHHDLVHCMAKQQAHMLQLTYSNCISAHACCFQWSTSLMSFKASIPTRPASSRPPSRPIARRDQKRMPPWS
jgi:hypothetical protein